MSDPSSTSPAFAPQARPLWPAYACECLASVGASLLQVGIFFYAEHRLGWGMLHNFMLASGQGAVYVVGSLLAARIAGRFGRRRALVGIYSAMTLVALAALLAPSPAWLVVALLAHTMIAAANWPALESIVTAGADAHEMSRRIGRYNLLWSLTNTVTFAASGTLIERWPAGMFIVPAVVHGLSALLMLGYRNVALNAGEDLDGAAGQADRAHVNPEPALLAQRTLAMWLARIALPATYVVVYGLMAMMPSLPVMRALGAAAATIVASTWMLARFGAFAALGASVWWHTRPRLLLAAAALMLVAFLGVTVRPSDLFAVPVSYTIDLSSMIAWQVILGIAMGMIYAASLYFGMVLSDGSTEHGGYHEALIGLGSILGPGVAALAQWRWPDDVRAGVIAVSAVVSVSVAAAAFAAVRAPRGAQTIKPRSDAGV